MRDGSLIVMLVIGAALFLDDPSGDGIGGWRTAVHRAAVWAVGPPR